MTALQSYHGLATQPSLKPLYKALADDLQREGAARARFRASLETADENARVEFINGEVVTQMPTKDRHSVVVRNTASLAHYYVLKKKSGAVRSEQSLTGFPRNDLAPDVCYWTRAKAKRIKPDLFVYPVPDFVVEVLSPSTERRDRGVKFRDYEANGVSEYWIVDPVARSVEQYLLRDGRYELVGKFTRGTIRSQVIKGFVIPVKAIFDEAENFAAMRKLFAK